MNDGYSVAETGKRRGLIIMEHKNNPVTETGVKIETEIKPT